MPEQTPSASEYRKVLTKILGIVNENPHLLGDSSYISLYSVRTDEQDNEYDFYGIKRDEKGKLVFCSSEGHGHGGDSGVPIGIGNLARIFEGYNTRYSTTPQKVSKSFLESIEEPLRRHLIAKAKIEPKTSKVLRELEQALAE